MLVQLGKGATAVLCRLLGSAMSPVPCFSEFAAICPSGPVPLLVNENGSFLSRYQFVAVFRRCLGELGFFQDGVQFSLVSDRSCDRSDSHDWTMGINAFPALCSTPVVTMIVLGS